MHKEEPIPRLTKYHKDSQYIFIQQSFFKKLYSTDI